MAVSNGQSQIREPLEIMKKEGKDTETSKKSLHISAYNLNSIGTGVDYMTTFRANMTIDAFIHFKDRLNLFFTVFTFHYHFFTPSLIDEEAI